MMQRVVAISNDETGISEDPNERFKVAKKIVEHAADYGIKPQDVVVDPISYANWSNISSRKSSF